MVLVLTMTLAPAPASARVQCYEENYGNGTCARTCVIYSRPASANALPVPYPRLRRSLTTKISCANSRPS
jgi:hypothetical protein